MINYTKKRHIFKIFHDISDIFDALCRLRAYNRNMESLYDRTELLLGKAKTDKLKNCAVIVIGLGGVGSYAAEALARCGVGRLCLVDNDVVAPSNINRQLYALQSTVGGYKASLAQQRVKDINPDCEASACFCRAGAATAEQLFEGGYDFAIEAIDDVEGKIAVVKGAQKRRVPVISAMGAANKTDPTMLRYADIYKTQICPLAKAVRRRCRDEGIAELMCVYSLEEPLRKKPRPCQPDFRSRGHGPHDGALCCN
jgi:tRNA A37 threonylcarbamoyladenosine dehydratase